jgi:hypothetical protein
MTPRCVLFVLVAGLLVPSAAAASPTWQVAVRLSPSERALSPELALTPDGAAAVVWDHEEGADCPTVPGSLSCFHIVEAATRAAGSAVWEAPVEVARPGLGALPRAAVDPLGDVAITWIHDIGDDRVQQATIRPPGAPRWPNANDLSGTPVRIKNHAIALDGQGDAVVVWAQRDNANFYVVGDLRPAAGGVWLPPVALSTLTADASSGPVLSVVPDGNVLVGWIDAGALRVAHGNAASGAWDQALTPAGGGLGTDTDVDVALNAGGDAIAAFSWRRSASGPNVVQASFRPAGGNWGAVVDLGTSADRSHVQAEINGAGAAAVVWRDATSLKAAGRAPASGTWSSPVTVATNVAETGAQLTMNSAGNAVAVWPNGTTHAIRAAIRPAGGGWQPPVRIGGAGSSEPRVALDALSSAFAVWNRAAVQEVLVESARLAPTGPVLANVTVPARTHVGSAATFTVTPRGWANRLVGAPSWHFGDGRTASGLHVSHTYRATGTFTVSVSQSDSSGQKSTATRKVTVTAH